MKAVKIERRKNRRMDVFIAITNGLNIALQIALKAVSLYKTLGH
jgi:hypothetical protein